MQTSRASGTQHFSPGPIITILLIETKTLTNIDRFTDRYDHIDRLQLFLPCLCMVLK